MPTPPFDIYTAAASESAQLNGHQRRSLATRTRLLQGAAELLRSGAKPSIEEVSVHSGVAKRTAHRYFVTREHMLAEAAVFSIQDSIDRRVEEALAASTVRARVFNLGDALDELSQTFGSELRTIVRISLDPVARPFVESQAAVRRSDRVLWAHRALHPYEENLSEEEYDLLVAAVVTTIGIDALDVLTDVVHVAPARTRVVTRWALAAYLDAVGVGPEIDGSVRPV